MARALASLDATLGALRADVHCEVFIRRTRRVCVEIEQGRTRVREGWEEGTAIRIRGAGGAVHFGAASGGDVNAAVLAQAAAWAHPGIPPRDNAPVWAGPGEQLDIEDPALLPEVAEVEAWLRRAAGQARATLDAAIGVETLGTGGGLRSCRVRGMVWARLFEDGTVRSAVARRLSVLDPADWDEPAGPSNGPWPPSSHPVVLLPGAAGALAPVLVAAVPVGAEAGPGWVCEDDPGDPDAPGGGRFDDTGFPAEPLLLADGRRVIAAPRGPGRRRRPSFRQPPIERAANLRFTPSGSWSGDGLLVRSVRIQPEGTTWCTALEGARAKGGRPISPWRRWMVRASPEDWVGACRAAVGPVRRTPEGVATGSLVFAVIAR